MTMARGQIPGEEVSESSNTAEFRWDAKESIIHAATSAFPCWQEQSLTGDVNLSQRKAKELAENIGSYYMARSTETVMPVPIKQQKAAAIARGKNQVVQGHDDNRTMLARLFRQPFQQCHLVWKIEMLQRLVKHKNDRLLREQRGCARAL